MGLTIGKKKTDKAVAQKTSTVPNLDGFKSKLPPIVDREEEERARSAAERFEEGPVIKALKTATWFAICALVAWEIYINSPLFTAPGGAPI